MTKKFPKGFTLTELLMTLIIMLLAAACAIGVYAMSYASWREATAQAGLQQEARIAMDRMVRGMRGESEDKKNGIREARAFSIPNSAEIRFTSGIDDIERRFYFDAANRQIKYRPASGNEIVTAKEITSLSFELTAAKRIRITLSSQGTVINKILNTTLTTEVLIRN